MEKFFESPKIGRMEKFTAFVPHTPLRLKNTAAISAQGGRPYAILHPSLCDPHIEFPVRKLIRLIVLSDRFSLCPECTSGSRNESCRPFFPEEIPCASGFPPDGEAPAARRCTPLSPDIAGTFTRRSTPRCTDLGKGRSHFRVPKFFKDSFVRANAVFPE